MNWKKLLSAVLSLIMILSIVSCGSTDKKSEKETNAKTQEEAQDTKASSDDKAPSGEEGLTEWEEFADIYNMDQTEEELYELAKEDGEVTIYSISSRMVKTVEAFKEKYPGIEVVSFDISTNELLEKVTREYDAGQHVADVVHIKDQDGTMYEEYILPKKMYNYLPSEIASHIDEDYRETQTPLYIEQTQLFYNEEAYPDGAPFDNIWEVTDPKWQGRLMMQNPLDNVAWGSWITGFCVGETPAELEAAYKELYGEDLELSPGSENAGYEFLKRLKANNPIYTTSSDEIAESVGTRGQENPPIGFAASSKIRKNEDNNWALKAFNLYPTNGISAVNTLYIVEGCEHPNAAKLFIYFLLGGTDGDTSGYEPFNTLGGWPVRDDIEPAEGSMPYDELNTSHFDATDIYENINLVRDFWQLLP